MEYLYLQNEAKVTYFIAFSVNSHVYTTTLHYY